MDTVVFSHARVAELPEQWRAKLAVEHPLPVLTGNLQHFSVVDGRRIDPFVFDR